MKVFNFILNLLFPPKCAACDNLIPWDETFCRECLPEIEYLDGKLCEKCGIPMNTSSPSPVCSRCSGQKLYFRKNISLLEHRGKAREAVLNMKYKSEALTFTLGRELARRIKDEDLNAEILTFVPMTRKEENKKSKNIPYLLSKAAGEELKVPVRELLVKVKETQKQKDLTAKQRALNVHNAFDVAEDVRGKTILIVDDVFTTGSTMNECAKMLVKNGAKAVYTATVSIRDRV